MPGNAGAATTVAHSDCKSKGLNKLHDEITRTFRLPEVRERYRQLGAEEFTLKPAEFDAFLAADTVAMGRIVKAAKIKLQ